MRIVVSVVTGELNDPDGPPTVLSERSTRVLFDAPPAEAENREAYMMEVCRATLDAMELVREDVQEQVMRVAKQHVGKDFREFREELQRRIDGEPPPSGPTS